MMLRAQSDGGAGAGGQWRKFRRLCAGFRPPWSRTIIEGRDTATFPRIFRENTEKAVQNGVCGGHQGHPWVMGESHIFRLFFSNKQAVALISLLGRPY